MEELQNTEKIAYKVSYKSIVRKIKIQNFFWGFISTILILAILTSIIMFSLGVHYDALKFKGGSIDTMNDIGGTEDTIKYIRVSKDFQRTTALIYIMPQENLYNLNILIELYNMSGNKKTFNKNLGNVKKGELQTITISGNEVEFTNSLSNLNLNIVITSGSLTK